MLVTEEARDFTLVNHRQIALPSPPDIPPGQHEHGSSPDVCLQFLRQPLAEVMGSLLSLLHAPILRTPRILEGMPVECDLVATRLFPLPARLCLNGEEPTLPHHNVVGVERFDVWFVMKWHIMEHGPAVSHELV